MVRVAVLGANGQLGQSLEYSLSSQKTKTEWSFFSSSKIDITSEKQLEQFFQNSFFDYIINCAAYTKVDLAESEHQNAKQVNVDAVKTLAKHCQIAGSILIHISTDFVFSGNQNAPYKEVDTPSPINVYGQTKWEGEQHISKHLEQHFILRTGWMYSNFGHNFIKTIQKLATHKKTLYVVYDQLGTPTHTKIVVDVIFGIISQRSTAYGTYHVGNEGVTSWYDFAVEIINVSGKPCKILPIRTEDFPTPARRPVYSVLDKEKVKQQFEIDLPHWRASLITNV